VATQTGFSCVSATGFVLPADTLRRPACIGYLPVIQPLLPVFMNGDSPRACNNRAAFETGGPVPAIPSTALFPVRVREAKATDIGPMHRIRLAVRENALTRSVISAEDYRHAMYDTGRGWVAEVNGIIRGFAIANRENGNIWALFVEPGFERRGIGRKLHNIMVGWLRDQGCRKLWLRTEAGTRADRFYRQAGWQYAGTDMHGEALFEFPAGAMRKSYRRR
jgi:GNAT superfamily N-acetyltransferase